jgi:hypothetical protein
LQGLEEAIQLFTVVAGDNIYLPPLQALPPQAAWDG